jgi:galactose-1-phosphate uridylyltransferase
VRRRRVDFEAVRRELGGRCFICELLAGNPEYAHHVVYEDEFAIAFLQRFQTLYGYVLVAPKEHREGVVDHFSQDEYAELQRVVHRVGRAVSRVVPTERLYVLSLGSAQGNSHPSTGTSCRCRRGCRSRSSSLRRWTPTSAPT